MSKLLGINQSQYSRIERGDADPSKHLKKLSEILIVTSEVFSRKNFKRNRRWVSRNSN